MLVGFEPPTFRPAFRSVNHYATEYGVSPSSSSSFLLPFFFFFLGGGFEEASEKGFKMIFLMGREGEEGTDRKCSLMSQSTFYLLFDAEFRLFSIFCFKSFLLFLPHKQAFRYQECEV